MIVRACGGLNIKGGSLQGVFLNGPNLYEVQAFIIATDGTSTTGFLELDAFVIPIDTSFKKADRMIREALASLLMNTNGWIIDPEDIYIPFSGN